MKPCRECGRKFVPESLAKHEPTCIQNAKKKRKVFDSSKQRATEDLSVRQIKQAQKKQVTPPKTHWRQKHQEFISNIRAAKGAQVAIDRGDPLPPPPPPSLNPDYITCPYCSRRFNEKAAERHINFCKDQQKRLPAKRQPTSEEKARAAARQKYAAQQQGSKSKASVGGSSSPSGGYSQTGGGYSQTGGGYSQSGGSYNSPAGRTTGGSRSTPASKPEAGRTPNSGGYGRGSTGYGSSAGKTTATRGRSTGSNQPSYQGRYAR